MVKLIRKAMSPEIADDLNITGDDQKIMSAGEMIDNIFLGDIRPGFDYRLEVEEEVCMRMRVFDLEPGRHLKVFIDKDVSDFNSFKDQKTIYYSFLEDGDIIYDAGNSSRIKSIVASDKENVSWQFEVLEGCPYYFTILLAKRAINRNLYEQCLDYYYRCKRSK